MLKKYFDWTPRDVAQWEALRRKGMGRFILWYGLAAGGLYFIIPGLIALYRWITAGGAAAGVSALASKLLVSAAVCLAAGIITALVTWAMEEKIYRKYYRGEKKDEPTHP